jgi:hypothetical protein
VLGCASSPDADETADLLRQYARRRCRRFLFRSSSSRAHARCCRRPAQKASARAVRVSRDLGSRLDGPRCSIEVVERLADAIESFRCLKVETVSPDVNCPAVRSRRPQLDLAGGWSLQQKIEALDRGVPIFTTTAVNLPCRRVLYHYEQDR